MFERAARRALEWWNWQRSAGLLVVVTAAVFPLLTRDVYLVYLGTILGTYVVVAMGLNLLFGFAGQVSLGHGALVAVGGYAVAILTTTYAWSFWAALPVAMAAAGVVGSLMALPALRLSTWYLAVITLAFAMTVNALLVELRDVTGGYGGIVGIPRPTVGEVELTDAELYWLVLIFVAVGYLVIGNISRSRIGRALISIRDAEEAARSAGARTVLLKVFAFFVSAVFAGLGGGLMVGLTGLATPDQFTLDFSIFFLLVVIVGGAGRLTGPIIGAAVFFALPDLLEALAQWRVLIYGIALLVLMTYAPHGIAGALSRPARAKQDSIAPRNPSGSVTDSVEGYGLDVSTVEKSFGGVKALAGASMLVEPGTVHAIVGPNGSGKTTLLNAITGYVRPDSGTIVLADRDITAWPPERVARLRVGRTFQTPRLLPELTAIDNVILGAYAQENTNTLQLLVGSPASRREAHRLRERALMLMDHVGLAGLADRVAGDLPHGQQRLVEIARSLMPEPSLLLMDEPAAGLSLTELDHLGELIRRINRVGTTIVLIEHHIELVADIADAVTVLHEGSDLISAPPDLALRDERVLDVYLGR